MKKIALASVTKNFSLGSSRGDGFLGRILDVISGKEKKAQKIGVDDVSFELDKGEIIGIIGRNGSGKSTLLRTIAGIYSLDGGSIVTYKEEYKNPHEGDLDDTTTAPASTIGADTPEILYINGFSHGIKPRLTMRENIYLVGTIMGLSKKQIEGVFDDVVSFSGLAEFVDTKVYQFSTGMILRLNFSIFIFGISLKNFDILLLDEVFGAGGDIDFKYKAEEKMNSLLKSGVTVILVSHSLSDIKKYCKRVIWLEGGKLKMDAEADLVINHYSTEKI
ncbi:MAG: ATP-binding cassette domain-containing protein [Candidatus Pacebacteria bacterium]|nr:ATP-binding cassette domain-containing protein [Candidatus Paceibacterota bacterium]